MVLTLYPEVQIEPIRDIWGNFSMALASFSPAEPLSSVYCTDFCCWSCWFECGLG